MDRAEKTSPKDARGHLTRSSIGANLLGAAVNYLYLQFLAPGAVNRGGSLTPFVVSALVFAGYLGVAIVASLGWMRPAIRAAAWLESGRPPTDQERRIALDVPRRRSVFTGAAWGGAAVIFGILNVAFGNPAVDVARIVVGIVFGGLVTTTLTYVLAERRYRPVVVLALGGEPERGRRAGIRGRLLRAWLMGSAVPLLAVGLVPFVRTPGGLVALSVSIASLAAIGLVAGFLLTSATAASVSEPLAAVRSALERVRGGDLSVHVEVDDPGEIGRLEADVNRMVAGLRERRRLHDLFGRHVGEAVATYALEHGAGLGGELRDVSVLFVDLIGSTALAASRPADEVVTVLNVLFGCVVRAVDDEGGWVNKFDGDGALCVFGAPEAQSDHAERVLRAARAMQAMLTDQAALHSGLDAGIGVSSGPAVAGNVGAQDRYEYTVVGDPVNEAARLCEAAKTTPGRVLASAATLEAAGPDEAARWGFAGETVLRGRDTPTVLMAPLSTVPTVPTVPTLPNPAAPAAPDEGPSPTSPNDVEAPARF